MDHLEQFRELLKDGVYRIKACGKIRSVRVIQDELGYALGKEGGGSAIEHWRKGNLPHTSDLEKLVKEIVKRSDLGATWVTEILTCANYPYPEVLCAELFPDAMNAQTESPQAGHVFRPALQSRTMPQTPRPASRLPNKTYRKLFGRDTLVREALIALQDTDGSWIVGFDGVGGIGKTALAHETVAHCVKRRVFNHVVWINAAGSKRNRVMSTVGSLTFEGVLDAIITQCGHTDMTWKSRTEKEIYVQDLLSEQPILVVLDNMETAAEPQNEIVEQLYDLMGPSKALLTSRHRFGHEVYAIHLDGLKTDSAVELVRQEAQERRIRRVAGMSNEALIEIVEATGGSPLAIKLVVGQLDHLPMEAVLHRLQSSKLAQRKDKDHAGIYRSIYHPSWELISELARKLLVSMALFVPEVGGQLPAIRAISGLTEDDVIDGLDELWHHSLVEVSENETQNDGSSDWGQLRYYLHPLTYYFVVSDICRFEDEIAPAIAPIPSQHLRPKMSKQQNAMHELNALHLSLPQLPITETTNDYSPN